MFTSVDMSMSLACYAPHEWSIRLIYWLKVLQSKNDKSNAVIVNPGRRRKHQFPDQFFELESNIGKLRHSDVWWFGRESRQPLVTTDEPKHAGRAYAGTRKYAERHSKLDSTSRQVIWGRRELILIPSQFQPCDLRSYPHSERKCEVQNLSKFYSWIPAKWMKKKREKRPSKTAELSDQNQQIWISWWEIWCGQRKLKKEIQNVELENSGSLLHLFLSQKSEHAEITCGERLCWCSLILIFGIWCSVWHGMTGTRAFISEL